MKAVRVAHGEQQRRHDHGRPGRRRGTGMSDRWRRANQGVVTRPLPFSCAAWMSRRVPATRLPRGEGGACA
jgi:hypothetical protein